MKIAVLLSAGRHPVSGRQRPVPVETQAIRLARDLGETVGMHAGPSADTQKDYFGHGIDRLIWLRIPADCDAVAALAAAIMADPPGLIIAGNRAEGGLDTGMLPYLLAAWLAWPLVNDAVRLVPDGLDLCVTQALEAGARRQVTVALPAIVTVSGRAPPPIPFAFGAVRRGVLIEREGVAQKLAATDAIERDYRPRPRLVRGAPAGGDAAVRLQQATGAGAAKGQLLVDPPPEEAARAILGFLDRLKLLPTSKGQAS